MALVRNRQADTLLTDAIVLDLGDLKRQGDHLMERARLTADRIIAQAQEQARRIIDAAEKTGYDAGHRKGMEEGLQTGRQAGHEEALAQASEALAGLQEAWQTVLSELDALRRQIVIDARQDLLALAMQIGRRVVHRTIEIDEAVIRDQLDHALRAITYRAHLVITVNPADAELVKQSLAALIDRFEASGSDQTVRVETDDDVTRGGCRVHHEKIGIDATIDTLLDRIESALLPRGSRTLPTGVGNGQPFDVPQRRKGSSTRDDAGEGAE